MVKGFAALEPYARNVERINALVEHVRESARIPGVALAIVAEGEVVFAKGYGWRDLDAKLPMTAQTVYPIASTSKAISATLLGMLVEEGRLAWDAPVQSYLPRFRLGDAATSAQVTVRDLVAMRTGLPRHDGMWIEAAISRSELVERLRHLQLSCGLRERFQYNNLTVTASGHVAEVVTGRSWEDLVRERILQPLEMVHTDFAIPASGNLTSSYHEGAQGDLSSTFRIASEITAPSGGALHSTVEDMARWAAFNLGDGAFNNRQLLNRSTLNELHSPWMVVGTAAEAISPHCCYGGGWFVDTYNGCARISHGGYLHDVNSEVSLFPEQNLAIVSCANFGAPRCARLINEHVFDLLLGSTPVQSLEQKLAQNRRKVQELRERNASARRVPGAAPSHPLNEYSDCYRHPGYGELTVECRDGEWILRRGRLSVPLRHWHYDAWIFEETDVASILPALSEHTNRLSFETGADGTIAALSFQFEPQVAPIRFVKESGFNAEHEPN